MSRRLLLATGSGGVVVPVDPDDPGGGGGGSDGFPATSDPIIQALRPSGVRVLGTVTAQPGTYIGDALADLDDVILPQYETPYGDLGPDHHGTVRIPPGDYQGGFGTSAWLAMAGTSGNPEDVVIFSDTIASDGVMHPYSPVYIEGVTLKAGYNAGLSQSPKYCAHISATGRTYYANCIFDATEGNVSGNAGTVGMDGGPGTLLIFYRCEFYDVIGNSRIGMNLHGGDLGSVGSKVMFIDCIAPKGVAYSYGAGAGEPGAPTDELYVIGGDIGGDIMASPGVHVYTDLDNPVTGSPDAVTRNHTTWPIPTERGLSGYFNDYFYPSDLLATGTTMARATVTDAAPMTPVAGRTYYCPVPVTTALHFNRWGVHFRSGAGKTLSWRPNPNKAVASVTPLTDMTTSVGQMLAGFFFSWIRYPESAAGDNYVWFNFTMPDTTGVTIDGSAELPGLHDCYYSDDNGTTLVKATAGTPFPLAHAQQVR